MATQLGISFFLHFRRVARRTVAASELTLLALARARPHRRFAMARFFAVGLALCSLLICINAWVPRASASTIAYYRFEEGRNGNAARGTNTIIDSSGNGLNASPFGGVAYSTDIPANPVPLTGATNLLSAIFNGSSGRVFIPDYRQLELTNSLTLEAFIKAVSPGGGTFGQAQIVFRGDDRAFWDPYQILLIGPNLSFEITDANNVISPVQAPISLNVWHHVAGTLDDATGDQSLYIDGLLVASKHTSERPFGPLTGPNTTATL